ncbi:MAG: hypothetical protein M3O32_19750, partial [Actinomycetota bacterium]|nr:hypothetical protein [Actinomycetota bacterium]
LPTRWKDPMTAPKFVANPPQGSGLVPSLVDKHYEDLLRGRAGELIPAMCLLQPVGLSQRRTKDGVHRTVTYEVVRLEPVRDPHEADQTVWEVTRLYERRTTPDGAQTSLALHNSPAEQREGLIEALRDWSSEHDIAAADLDAKWLSHFGGPQYAASATVQAGSLLQLMEFARVVGAVKDEEPGEVDSPFDDDPDPDDGPDDDPDAGQAGEPDALAIPITRSRPRGKK